jgi:FkbM family methyltransferase
MSFQTVFYHSQTGDIFDVYISKYLKSTNDKIKLCPGHPPKEIYALYFQSLIPVIPEVHRVKFFGNKRRPIVCEPSGTPLIYSQKKIPFLKAITDNKTIIVDFHDGMGDKLYRAACVLAAQKKYPKTKFYCRIDTAYIPIMSLVPDINIFIDYKTHGLDKKQCADITCAPSDLAVNFTGEWTAPARYGLFFDLQDVPYNIKLNIPKDFDKSFDNFSKDIKLRADGHNIVFQLRTKDLKERSWSLAYIDELAARIKSVYDCNIYYLGMQKDYQGSSPNIINLCGKTSWLETIFLLRKSSHVFCIDSSILHICRALDIPRYCLWGITQPYDVTTSQPDYNDFGTEPPDSVSPALKITPDVVFNRVFSSIPIPSLKETKPLSDQSQHGEQAIILKWFEGHPPKYKQLVDVGAYGKSISNSFALLSMGWHGILIEANPARIPIIKKEFKGLNIDLLNTGISDKEGSGTLFTHTEPGHNSILKEWYPETLDKKSKKISLVRLPDILASKNIPHDFDMLSIDTEGMDYLIVADMLNKSLYRPKLIITECTSYHSAEIMFKRKGYSLVAFTGPENFGNYIYGLTD